MDQTAMGAVARDNVIEVDLATDQRRFAVVEPEATLRPFRPVTAEAGLFEDWADVPIKIDRDVRWGWKPGDVDLPGESREDERRKN